MSHLFVVSCTHVDTDRRRRFAVVAGDSTSAIALVARLLGGDLNQWRAQLGPYRSVLEIGLGGDVGIGGLC